MSNKDVNPIRFKRTDNIGHADAESDGLFLQNCFDETSDIEVLRRADEFGAENDIEGQRTWTRIMKAIEELQRARAPGEPVH